MSYTSFFISLSSTRSFSFHLLICFELPRSHPRRNFIYDFPIGFFVFFFSFLFKSATRSFPFFSSFAYLVDIFTFFPLQKCVIPVYNRTQTVLLLNMSPYFSSFKMHLHDSWNVCTPMQLCREKGFANICDRKLICCPNAYRQRRRAVGPVSS